ncbi:hypothetical protein BDR04DRAFT_1118287 [Suillus decipiens]|nr:hypothetical protein BDR04DRAFT_1118287 [Suillus decipiens]
MPTKGPSKKGGKTALLEAQDNLCAEMQVVGNVGQPKKKHIELVEEKNAKSLRNEDKEARLKGIVHYILDTSRGIRQDEDNMFLDCSVPTRLPNQHALTYTEGDSVPIEAGQPTWAHGNKCTMIDKWASGWISMYIHARRVGRWVCVMEMSGLRDGVGYEVGKGIWYMHSVLTGDEWAEGWGGI